MGDGCRRHKAIIDNDSFILTMFIQDIRTMMTFICGKKKSSRDYKPRIYMLMVCVVVVGVIVD